MANLRTNNLSGEQGQKAIRGSLGFHGSENSTDYLTIGSAGDFNYLHDGTSDWTVEFFIRPSKVNDRQTVFSTGGNSSQIGFACRIMEDGASGGSNGYKVLCQFSRGASGNYLGFLGGVIDNKDFSHVALVFTTSNKQLAIYINGQLTNSSDLDGTADGTFGSGNFSSSNSSYALTIGRENYSTTLYLDSAFLSNLRIVEGETVYTAAFTPPTSELTIIPNTTLLCCQDSNVPTQEATGKTITANGNFADLDFVKQQPVVIPKVGVDAGNTFGGPIQQSSQGYMYFPTGRTEERGRGRVVIFGDVSTNEFFEMASGGITNVFGSANFTLGGQHASCSSTTRAVRMNGYSPSTAPIACNVMEFVTIATQSNATDFGDSTRACRYNTGFGSHTRGINANGNTPGAVNTIDFITIATTGDATDFGDLTQIDNTLAGSTSNSTRGLINGCEPGTNITEFVTIASTGNGQDFGDTTVSMEGRKGAASSTRALLAGGYSHPTFATINTIDFFTIATTGNATDFGDMTYVAGAGGGTSDSVRAVIMGGYTTPGNTTNAIDVVTIATTGDAIDFGDMRQAMSTSDGATSDSHGGLT